jgi:agmatinase
MIKPAYNNFLGLDSDENPWDEAHYCVLQAPLEHTSSFQSGCAKGPQAILRASEEIQRWDEDLDSNPSSEGIATLSIDALETLSLAESLAKIESKISYVVQSEKWPLLLGGEQTLALASIKALRKKFPDIVVVFLDGFLNLKNKVSGSKNHHCCITRRCLEAEFKCWHLGVRTRDQEEIAYAADPSRSLKILSLKDLREGQIRLSNLDEFFPEKQPVYLSIDLGVLDPSVCPGVTLPEPGGLLWNELLWLVEKLFSKNSNVVGADICGLSPIPNEARSEYLAARLAYKILCLHSSLNRNHAVTTR